MKAIQIRLRSRICARDYCEKHSLFRQEMNSSILIADCVIYYYFSCLILRQQTTGGRSSNRKHDECRKGAGGLNEYAIVSTCRPHPFHFCQFFHAIGFCTASRRIFWCHVQGRFPCRRDGDARNGLLWHGKCADAPNRTKSEAKKDSKGFHCCKINGRNSNSIDIV